MSIDMGNIFQQYPFRSRLEEAMAGIGGGLQVLLQEQERWRRMVQPQYVALPGFAQLIEQHRLMGQTAKQLRLLDLARRGPSSLDQFKSVADTLRLAIGRVNLEAATIISLSLGTASDELRRSLQQFSEQVRANSALTWDELDAQLKTIEAGIEHLPPPGADEEQVRATGLSLHGWVFLILAIFSAIHDLWDVLESHAAQQAAERAANEERGYRSARDNEEREFRARLLSAFEAAAERCPEQYVVGARATPVKSAITRGRQLDTANPNQVVVATGKQGRWVKVKYRNHLEDRDVEGWILKRYLIRLSETTLDGCELDPDAMLD